MPPQTATIQSAFLAFQNEVVNHRQVFGLALAEPHTHPADFQTLKFRFAEWYAIVGLTDSWGRFWKAAILASAEGKGPTLNGHPITRSRHVAVGVDSESTLKTRWKARFRNYPMFGPSWHKPSAAVDAASVLDVSNLATISGALLASTYAPAELAACRNYLAHRHPGTEHHPEITKLRRRLGLTNTSPHTELLAMERVPGNRTLYDDWCIELETIARTALA